MKSKYATIKIGDRFKTSCGMCTVLKYIAQDRVLIEFDSGFLKCVRTHDLHRGFVRDPYYPTVEGIGFLGEGKYQSKIGDAKVKAYTIWGAMIRRCYNEAQQVRQPTYLGCTVVEEWHNYQNFAKWYEANYVEGWDMDKDLLVTGNKVYSPDTCCFIPPEVNAFFTYDRVTKGSTPTGVSYRAERKSPFIVTCFDADTGGKLNRSFKTVEEALSLYKNKKELQARWLADKYKDRLSEKAYTALYSFVLPD